VAEVTEAERLLGTKPCLHCKKPTKNENQLHKRCSKPFNEQLQKLQEEQRQKEQNLKLISLINMTKLNPVEDRFIADSVQGRIMKGQLLSPKQWEWLISLARKYPQPK
jgi:hypothetical protein